jgi:ubiquinone/menaquinone biosynthesis C-methylase UbiE
LILNIGCGGRSGDKAIRYGNVRIDIKPFPNVTLVMDAHDLAFGNETFDKVVGYEVLEHLASPIKALNEMNRVLKPDGEIELSVPNLHYWRRIFNSLFRCKRVLKMNYEGDHKQGWDVIVFRSLCQQIGLEIVEAKPINWYPKIKNRMPWLDIFFKPIEMLYHTHIMYRFRKI